MLISKLLERKRVIKRFGKDLTDLISSTFRFPQNLSGTGGAIVVGEFESMRPDLIADRIYGRIQSWDVLLKYNGISNPFSIETEDILYGPAGSALDAMYASPREIQERDQRQENRVSPFLDPRTKKDKDRLNNLKQKAGAVLPPNINKPGDRNVKIRDGRVVFGEDVTGVNKKNCPVPISRTRLQAALLKDKLSI
jgi:hypothetical protein